MDGTRYIEDDPNALETNVLDYVAARTEKGAAKEALEQSVTDTFNNYISVRRSYMQFLKNEIAASSPVQGIIIIL